MRRITLSALAVVAVALVFVLGIGATVLGAPPQRQTPNTKRQTPSRASLRTHPLEGCNTAACDKRVLARDHLRAVAQRKREAVVRARELAAFSSATASWFEDPPGTTAGPHQSNGFAALIYGAAWGLPVRFCYRGRCAVGHLEDHGPYVSGRTFDLGSDLRNALGFDGVDVVRYAVLKR